MSSASMSSRSCAGGLGARHDLRDQRLEPALRAGDALAPVAAGEGQLAQPAVGGLQLEDADEELLEPGHASSAASASSADGQDRVHAVVEERVDQLFLVAEAAVDRADADARVVGDVVERDLEAARRRRPRRRPRGCARGCARRRGGAGRSSPIVGACIGGHETESSTKRWTLLRFSCYARLRS